MRGMHFEFQWSESGSEHRFGSKLEFQSTKIFFFLAFAEFF